MTQRNKNLLMMLLIIAPFALTMAFVHLFVDLEDLDRTNKGTLLIPHVQIESLKPSYTDGRNFTASELAGQWTILYVAAGDCGTACKNGLYYLVKQLRLGLGSDAPQPGASAKRIGPARWPAERGARAGRRARRT